MRKMLTLLSVLALASLALGACGGGGDTSTEAATTSSTSAGAGGGGGGTISISADPSGQLAYTETAVTAPAGNDTVRFDNQASLSHDVVIEDADGNEVARTDVISGGSTSTTAKLEPGEYTFFCSVDGHRDAGMEGTLTVK